MRPTRLTAESAEAKAATAQTCPRGRATCVCVTNGAVDTEACVETTALSSSASASSSAIRTTSQCVALMGTRTRTSATDARPLANSNVSSANCQTGPAHTILGLAQEMAMTLKAPHLT